MEKFGCHFLTFCVDSGYGRLLRVLGGNFYDFLCNLDTLHEHLSCTYGRINAPSFRCHLHDDGSYVLHYYSNRKNLEHMVVGMLKKAAWIFFDLQISVRITYKDHVVLYIKEDSLSKILIRKRSSSLVNRFDLVTGSKSSSCTLFSTQLLCEAFPFHLIIDRSLTITQCGLTLLRILQPHRSKHKHLNFNEVFKINRPVITNDFDSLLNHISAVFILTIQTTTCETCSASQALNYLKLQGQMTFLPESDSILFTCSPRVPGLR